jgi:hypothetical protein
MRSHDNSIEKGREEGKGLYQDAALLALIFTFRLQFFNFSPNHKAKKGLRGHNTLLRGKKGIYTKTMLGVLSKG